LGYSSLNVAFVKKLLAFSLEHLAELRGEQATILNHSGAHYPLMKLVDMYFWQLGFEVVGPEED
jgi:hypothetical protein